MSETPQTNGTPPAGGGAPHEPYFVGLYDKEGKIQPQSFDRLPEDLKPYKEEFSKFPTIDTFFRSYLQNRQFASEKIPLPLPPNSPPAAVEHRAQLLAKINGSPPKPEDYGFKRPDDVPEEFWSDDFAKQAATILHKHQASPGLAKELIDFQVAFTKQAVANFEQGQQAALAEQDNLYGSEIKKLNLAPEKANELVTRAAGELGISDNDPAFRAASVRMALLKHALTTGEDTHIEGAPAEGAGMPDPMAEAIAIMSEATNSWHAAYADENHALHDQAVARVGALFEKHAKASAKAGRL